MKQNLLILALVFAIVGCGSDGDQNTEVTTDAKPAPVQNDPAKAALLAPMTDIARKTKDAGKWESLSADQKKPFLDFQDGNEKRAQKHYEELATLEREQPID